MEIMQFEDSSPSTSYVPGIGHMGSDKFFDDRGSGPFDRNKLLSDYQLPRYEGEEGASIRQLWKA